MVNLELVAMAGCCCLGLILIISGSFGVTYYLDGHAMVTVVSTCEMLSTKQKFKRDAQTIYYECHSRNSSFFPHTTCNVSIACVCDNIYCLNMPDNQKENRGLALSVVSICFGVLGCILMIVVFLSCYRKNITDLIRT